MPARPERLRAGTGADAVPAAVVRAFRRDLLAWFRRCRRKLPWRVRRTPYRVWVAEVMLQQTRADQAAPYYRRFMRRFPSMRALAAARRGEVLKHWEGLGYYARARRLHDTARYLVRSRGGRFPATLVGLLALPGIGPYTAAAVGSLAMNLDAAVVDGNVVRVLARVFGIRREAGTAAGRHEIEAYANRLLPKGRAGRFNEALMELGALCCLPRNPLCAGCPLRLSCVALRERRPESYPRRRRKGRIPHKVVGAAVVVNRRGEILLARRREQDMLGGMWEFPGGTCRQGESLRACIARELREELGIRARVGPPLITVRHAFTHFTMDLHAHWARIRSGRPRALQCDAVAWVPIRRLRAYPMPRADVRVVDALERMPSPLWGRVT